MSLKSELAELCVVAEQKIHAVEELSTSERSRLLDGVAHLHSAVVSSEDPAVHAEVEQPAEKAPATVQTLEAAPAEDLTEDESAE